MAFLNHKEGGYVGFPPFSFSETVRGCVSSETVRGCVSLKKCKSQGKAVEVAVNNKEENS
jgi:hypothetical protein